MAMGRPTKYRDEYCDQIVTFMKEGRSIVQFAADIGVAKSAIYRWADEFPDFRDSLERGKDAAEAYWEGYLQQGAIGLADKINVAATALILKCRFGWRDKDPLVLGDKDKAEDRAEAAEKLRMSTMRGRASDR